MTTPSAPRRRLDGEDRQIDAIIEAAWCYYHDGLNQSDIAARMGVSRASVVNYLAEARRRNYVRISLDTEIFRASALAERIRERFGLAGALVVPSDAAEVARSSDRVIRAASDWLPQLLEPGDRLGVAWGETIYRLAGAAPHQPIRELTVVQLLGSRPAALGFAAETCSATLAARFDARCVNLHVPLLLSDEDLCTRLKREPVVAEQLRAVADCNKVVFAAGTCGPDSHMARTGLLDRDRLAEFRAAGAAGVICGRLIDAAGRPMRSEIEDRMIGVTLEQMRDKPLRLLVAADADRLEASRAAILGGYATHLATSSDMAEHLLGGAR
ncbi:sugar-binding transcriptional regulator [Limimaricola pyoseonensis]|uniref:DNA-binding transcriptional regulator LsrR, DeoR family n=1 Tax=Limimaricola pyoseonensis TaxID=521013 RepID=A0A1G7FML2_9RHOB|nr:sugar-binding transcriptional regulator [Limimaricola pyoseonensis]SDE76895.1 DNA-binding transcriptional regulator LsrR, DeoR family [Limimaricola pyoseonensis]